MTSLVRKYLCLAAYHVGSILQSTCAMMIVHELLALLLSLFYSNMLRLSTLKQVIEEHYQDYEKGSDITKTRPCNILQYFTAVKMLIFR